jgi:hypothetical protein
LDFLLWRNAMISICLSHSRNPRLGCFTAPNHKIWQWTWSKDDASLHHLKEYGVTEDIFVSRKKPNCFHYSHSQPHSHHNMIRSVKPTLGNGSWRLTSLATRANPPPGPQVIHRCSSLLGKHLAVGSPKGDGRHIIAL